MALVDIMLAFPQLILGLCHGGCYSARGSQYHSGPGLTDGSVMPGSVRAEVLALREREFVQAARAVGCRNLKIVSAHHAQYFSSVIVMATLQTAQAILAERH